MDPQIWALFQTIATVISTLAASSGFWIYVTRKAEKDSAERQLLLGLAHERIVFLGMKYVDRGYITPSEYDSLVRHLYEPYLAAGGNGTAARIMDGIKDLPISQQKGN